VGSNHAGRGVRFKEFIHCSAYWGIALRWAVF
jgi:hypothetical protein